MFGGRRVRHITYDSSNTTAVGGRPDISPSRYFSHFQVPVRPHAAIITVGNTQFLVQGYTSTTDDHFAMVNQVIAKVMPSIIWRGEVLVLVLGMHNPYQAHPRVKRKVVDEAAAL
jgi:hypothetical protein